MLSLLDVTFDAELVDEEVIDIAAREEDEAKRRSLETKRLVRTPTKIVAIAPLSRWTSW